MALVLFHGMELEVRAADYSKTIDYYLRSWETLGTNVPAGTTYELDSKYSFFYVTVYCKEDTEAFRDCLSSSSTIESTGGLQSPNVINFGGELTNAVKPCAITVQKQNDISEWDIDVHMTRTNGSPIMVILLSPAEGSSSENPVNTTGGQKDRQDSTSKAPAAPVHTHSYSWVTVQEANSEQDGIEEYRCSCGDVQERNIIPASEVLIKGLFGEIKDAPLNGSSIFDTGRQYTLSDYIIRKLSERTDVTTVITFEYEGQSYRMTIPAGADYSQLLADEDYFYGYFYFASAVGATIEAL